MLFAALATHLEAEEGAVERTRSAGAPTFADVLACCYHPAVLSERTVTLAELTCSALASILPQHKQPSLDLLLELFGRDECNGFGYWSKEYERQACGFVPGAAVVNHSCCPSAAKVQGPGFSVELRALRRLTLGEEVTFSYVPLACGYEERQQVLNYHFAFSCTCVRCRRVTQGGPDVIPPVAHDCGGVIYPRPAPPARGLSGALFGGKAAPLACSICRRPFFALPGDKSPVRCAGGARQEAKRESSPLPDVLEHEYETDDEDATSYRSGTTLVGPDSGATTPRGELSGRHLGESGSLPASSLPASSRPSRAPSRTPSGQAPRRMHSL
jgi:hypothetical protein